MTSGVKPFGTSVLTSLQCGSVNVLTHYGSKTWSGNDSPPTRYETRTYVIPADYRRVRVYRGREQITIVHRSKIRRYRDYTRNPRPLLGENSYSMTYSKEHVPITRSRVYLTYSGGWQAWNTCADKRFLVGPSPWTANDDIALLGKLREKIAGSSFNAGVAIAESREALVMITQAATKIAKSLLYAKRGRFDLSAKALFGDNPEVLKRHKSARNYLELQYGWLPLLMDVKEGAEFLAHNFATPQKLVVRARRKIPSTIKPDNPTLYRATKSSAFVSKEIKAILTEKDTVALSGLLDPLSVAWELVPFSFVADWFIPIGNYLQARQMAQSLKGTFVTSTFSKAEAQGFTPMKFPPTNGAQEVEFNAADNYLRKVTLTREVSTTLAVPFPVVKPLSRIATWTHAVNAVALTQAVFGPKKLSDLS